MTWDAHISSVSKKVSSGIGDIKKIKPFVPTSNLISVFQSIVEPYLDYCSVVWDDISDQLTDKLQTLQNRSARVITGADYRMPTSDLLSKLGLSSLKEKRNKQKGGSQWGIALVSKQLKKCKLVSKLLEKRNLVSKQQ